MNGVWIPMGLALFDWLGLRLGQVRWQPITRTAVMVGVMTWILLDGPGFGTPVVWFFIGICFSLIGDMLLLPAVDRFGPAFGIYLLAKLAYLAGLNTTPFPVNFSTALFAAIVTLLAWRVYRRIAAGPQASLRPEMRIPVLLYTIAMSGTVFSGLATLANEAWPPVPALLAAGGVVSLVIADIVLAWDRFVRPLPGSVLKHRAAYHLGQIALIGAALLFFI